MGWRLKSFWLGSMLSTQSPPTDPLPSSPQLRDGLWERGTRLLPNIYAAFLRALMSQITSPSLIP